MTQLQEESVKNPLRYQTSGFAAALNGILENTVQRWYRIAEELQEKRSEYSGTFCKPDTIEACKI